jgi:hypothetical protein
MSSLVLRQHPSLQRFDLEPEDTSSTRIRVSVFWVRPHTRGCPSRCFRSRTVSPTVAKWFVLDARGTMDNVYRFDPLGNA